MKAPRVTTIKLTDVLREVAGPGRVRIDRDHGDRRHCPTCGEDCMTIGVTELAYTFEVCDCRNDGITYDHLVEQLWHRNHLDGSRPGLGTAGVTGAQPDEPVTQAGRPASGGAG